MKDYTARAKRKTIRDYPIHLRGLPNNRYGGHKATRLRTYPGTFGPAGPCVQYTDEQKTELEAKMKKQGII